MSNALYWLFSPYRDQFLEWALPLFCLLLLIVWILIYLNLYMRTCEIVSLVAFTMYHLFRIYAMTTQVAQGIMNVYMLWSTTYYTYIFLALERKRALAFSLFIFLITIILGIPYLQDSRVHEILTQYYLSTIVYMVILYYFQQIVSAYIEADMLKKHAYFDALTNIGNRRSIDKWLEKEFERCYDTSDFFSVIIFDIDHFKKINDKFGHDIGDHVLKEFTSLVKNCLHPDDLFGRWGGEEFIIILKDKTLLEAAELAENLRNIIESHSFRFVGHITSSFGVSTFRSYDVPKTLIKRADQALYMAKKKGRNMVQTL